MYFYSSGQWHYDHKLHITIVNYDRKNLIAQATGYTVVEHLTCNLTIKLGNCDIHAQQKILFINETNFCEIQPRPNGWVQKIFHAIMPNFIEGFNESWHKFCPFCVDESEGDESKG